MAITKAKKQEILSKLEELKGSADSIVFVHFNKIGGNDVTAMRAQMREAGVDYFVAKKTLVQKAFADTFAGEMPSLEGEIALAYSTDAIAPAQNVKEFGLKFKDNFTIEGGVFQGVYKSKEEMTEIASIPALPVLRGMFVNVINSPIQGLAIVLDAYATKKAS